MQHMKLCTFHRLLPVSYTHLSIHQSPRRRERTCVATLSRPSSTTISSEYIFMGTSRPTSRSGTDVYKRQLAYRRIGNLYALTAQPAPHVNLAHLLLAQSGRGIRPVAATFSILFSSLMYCLTGIDQRRNILSAFSIHSSFK